MMPPTVAAIAPRETDIVRACLDVLRLRGIFAWRQNCGAAKLGRGDHRRYIRFTSVNGVSDIIGVLPGGRILAVECKRPGNGPTPDQTEFINAVNRRGGLGVVVYNADDLTEIIDREVREAVA